MMLTIIPVIITLIEQVLPLLGTSTATVGLVTTIITTLEGIVPLAVNLAPTVISSIKNIIIALKADPTVTADQWAKLDVIDAQLDVANDAAIAAIDPDAAPSG